MIEVPERFKVKLDLMQKYSYILQDVIYRFDPILQENKLEFFPEYTDHGFKHINNTLMIIDKIIPDETFGKLNCKDILIIILSVIIHDLGMHITYDIFNELIYGKLKDRKDQVMKDKEWKILWDEYITDAKLWSYKKIKSVLGDDTMVEIPPRDSNNATEKDKKFIGEFLRRNHPRLAYEICIYGFPTIIGERLELCSELDEQEKKILGFIVRSHGESIWDALGYIEREFDMYEGGEVRAPKDIHAIYIMVLLRIGDYLDVDKERANTAILKFKHIKSSISKLEWDKHKAIDGIKFESLDDPESIFIRVNRVNKSSVYLAICNLIKDIQKELDTCWAVLGKVYGNFENLKLSFRRINSNINNKEKYLENTHFVAEEVKFNANPDIVQLLVKPLYGDDPSYGVRELLQNAIDACREKEKMKKYKASVSIEILEEKAEKWFIIKDNGIGMNQHILINYFFVAGSSFRNSNLWKKIYSENNKSTIARSGKFGVGIFSAFILGDNLEVNTSRLGEAIEYKFKASVGSEQIEISKNNYEENKSGTTIKIKMENEVFEVMRKQWESFDEYRRGNILWHNWYQADKPEIKIKVPRDWVKYANPTNSEKVYLEESDKKCWNSIFVKDYERVDWGYLDQNYVYCNGITISWNSAYNVELYRFPSNFKLPSISVIDYNGNFPLTLNRNAISNKKLPFEKELIKDIYKDIIAKLLIYENVSELSDTCIRIKHNYLYHQSISMDRFYWTNSLKSYELLLTKNGYNICHHYYLKRLNKKIINKIYIEKGVTEISNIQLVSKIENLVIENQEIQSISDFKKIIYINPRNSSIINLGADYRINGMRIFLKQSDYNNPFIKEEDRIKTIPGIRIEEKSSKWIVISNGHVENTNLNVSDIENNDDKIKCFIQYYYEEITLGNTTYDESVKLDDIMEQYIGSQINIPYNLDERKKKYRNAFDELNKYMKNNS